MSGKTSGKASKHRDRSPRKNAGKLARRAKSFKEDVIGRINLMRNSPATLGTSTSPQKPSSKSKPKHSNVSESANGSRDKKVTPQKEIKVMLEEGEKLLNSALIYFQDVVDKDKLEMLPGCATEVLKSVYDIHMILKNCLINEDSSLLTSASSKVYQSLANLIRWSDNLVLCGNKTQNTETVSEIVQSVQNSVSSLIELVVEKVKSKTLKTNVAGSTYQKPDSPSNSNPLPDIPLTPREREILEQTSVYEGDPSYALNHSASSDSILNSANNIGANNWEVIPPKPPLPFVIGQRNNSNRPLSCGDNNVYMSSDSSANAPPLPPKRRSANQNSFNTQDSFFDSFNSSQVSSHGPSPSPPPNMSGSFYDNTDGPGFSNYFNDFRNDIYKSEFSNSFNADWCNNRSPDSSISKSPTSSLDSILDKSTEDIIMSVSKSASSNFCPMDPHMDIMGKNSISVTSVSKTSREYKYSSYSSSTSSKITNEELCLQMSSSSTSSRHSSSSVQEQIFASQNPPALPIKQRKSTGSTHSRTPSQYDNVPDLILPTLEKHKTEDDFVQLRSHLRSPDQLRTVSPQSSIANQAFSYHCAKSSQSYVDGNMKHNVSKSISSSAVSCPIHGDNSDNIPPPLPPKRKNIMAYMQMLGNYSSPNESEFYRHSVHTYNLVQAQIQQHQAEQRCFTMYNTSEMWSMNSFDKGVILGEHSLALGPSKSVDNNIGSIECSPPVLPPKKNRYSTNSLGRPKRLSSMNSMGSFEQSENSAPNEKIISAPMRDLSISKTECKEKASESPFGEHSLLDLLDVEDHLVYKTDSNDDGPDIRGGPIDALIVHATKSSKHGHIDFIFNEAFLATYRTFIPMKNLVHKLIYRYNRFINMVDLEKQRAARNAFAFLIRVVNNMCVSDAESGVVSMLTEFISQLVSKGELVLAKKLREKVIEKCHDHQRAKNLNFVLLPSMSLSSKPAVLLDFKAKHIAKQMTLMDSELFQRIEIPEVLLWAKEQSEELSPNLTTFTEHFNKISYWARSRILEQDEAKEREKFVLKFINIMKHLRMLNNFNSYLALLSALDSAPIRRLEWQKDITEGLKEYCQLIDSSSSFRTYRQALAETEPPCIPYIGLILQDLTFVHIGNNDLLPDNNTNFAKRWQQFNILGNMSRFKTRQHSFKKNDQILSFFNNFDHYLCEEAMWQISESIKPRGGKKKTSDQS